MAKMGRPFGSIQFKHCINDIVNAVSKGGSIRAIHKRYNEQVVNEKKIGSPNTIKRYLDVLVEEKRLTREPYEKIIIYKKKNKG